MSDLVYQLVIQFPESAFTGFDDVVAFEDLLIEALADRHDVDGHDIGSGEVNFFVLTDDPTAALRDIQEGTEGWLTRPGARAGARPIDGDDYEPLWPVGDPGPFTIS